MGLLLRIFILILKAKRPNPQCFHPPKRPMTPSPTSSTPKSRENWNSVTHYVIWISAHLNLKIDSDIAKILKGDKWTTKTSNSPSYSVGEGSEEWEQCSKDGCDDEDMAMLLIVQQRTQNWDSTRGDFFFFIQPPCGLELLLPQG